MSPLDERIIKRIKNKILSNEIFIKGVKVHAHQIIPIHEFTLIV